MKQKSIILIVRSNSTEIYWILTVLYKLYKKYIINTIFKKEKSLSDLKKNKELFVLWKKVSKKNFIKKNTDNILSRSILYLLHFFMLENSLHLIKNSLLRKFFYV